ncbi:MAG: phosphoglycerate dehydrogenase [Dehalococcoidia bacterium]|nr:phosphoglycerate dehydrogenase [Dehalococcoidia bacterium]MDW8119213.1 phosphoglycerate dehydrogenase [Chloroflexota bacterium]
MPRLRILVADPLHPQGVEFLRSQPDVEVVLRQKDAPAEAFIHHLREAHALIVRSETKVTSDLFAQAPNLVVVGRAGVGVDNIDVEEATRRGVAVVNAPTGNIIAAAEHTIALLLAVARRIPQAHASLQRGEWKRSQFIGTQVRDKTLGIIGLGRVGSQVAQRARGLQMRLLAYDPFVSADFAQRLGVTLVPLERLLQEADFVTIHAPLTPATRHLIGTGQLALMKPGAYLINVARGDLVDEEALLRSLNEGRLAGAALDVFSQEPPPADHPLLRHPRVVVTPHLGASTEEAQAEVAQEVAEQVLAVLRGQPSAYTINAPMVVPESQKVLAPYLPVATTLGRIAIQLLDGQLQRVVLRYQGEIAQHDTTILKAAALVGLLQPTTDQRVNLVNAQSVATRRGLVVAEEKGPAPEHYASLLGVELEATGGRVSLVGTAMRGEVHIVQVKGYWLDLVPSAPYLLFIDHHDRPGLIGAVGSITGRHDINISFMEVGRFEPRGRAMMVLGLDDPMPPEVLAQVRALPYIYSARLVHTA